MEQSTVEQIFNGVGVIIDDDVFIPGKPANNTLNSLQNANIPMVAYSDIPDIAVINSFGNISFIILDWEFSIGRIIQINNDDDIAEVIIPDSVKEDQRHTVLSFLKTLLEKVFVPVFIITGQDFQKVKSSLVDEGIYNDGKPNRLMLKTKDDIKDYPSLIRSVKSWLEIVPAAQVLKLWDSEAVLAKNKMFLDLFAASPNWVSILLRILKEDANDRENAVNQEFIEILNGNFVNRFLNRANYCAIDVDSADTDPDDVRRVLEGERYISYKDITVDDCYTGDLYYIESDQTYPYRLNIRAQCDLSRDDNPRLYLLSGKAFDQHKVITDNRLKVCGSEDKTVLLAYNKQYSLNDLINDKSSRKEFNIDMSSYQNSLLFSHNEVIERKTHSIIACVAGEFFVEFNYREFEVMRKQCLDARATKIGRILPPYITKVQSAFASYMIRTGIMPIPEELVNDQNKISS